MELTMKRGRVIVAVSVLVLMAGGLLAAANQPFLLQLLNGSSLLGTFTNYGQLKCSTGMSCSLSGSTFTMTASGGAGTVTSVSGTTNQIDVATGTTTPVISLDAAIQLPGSLTAGTGTSIGVSGSGTNTATALNVLTTLGDILYENSTPANARLAGNTSSTRNFLAQTGNGTISATPAWVTLSASDIPALSTSAVTPPLYAADTGAVNAAVVTLSPAMTAYTTGVIGCFKVTANNTSTTPTVNFNGLGVVTIVMRAGGAIGAGDMTTTAPACVIYDGAHFNLINPQSSTGTGKTVLAGGSPQITGTWGAYNNETTAGLAMAYERGATSQKAETATADASVLTVTPASAAGTYRACVVISVSAATSGVISWTLSWTDSNGNAQSNIAQPLFQFGTAAPNTTFTTSAAGNYSGCSMFDVNNAGAAITVKWVGGGTTTAKMSALIERMQ
jgi:hypothetical protein